MQQQDVLNWLYEAGFHVPKSPKAANNWKLKGLRVRFPMQTDDSIIKISFMFGEKHFGVIFRATDDDPKEAAFVAAREINKLPNHLKRILLR